MKSTPNQDLLPFSYTSPYFQEDPLSYLAKIRELEPIHWSDVANCWVITRYEDCKALIKHPNIGKDDWWRIASSGDEPLQIIDEFRKKLMNYNDPPEHRRLRGYFNKAFTPKIVSDLRPAIHEVMDQLLADYADQHEMNLVEAVSYPLPIMIISAMLGVPTEDWQLIRQFSESLTVMFDRHRTQEALDSANNNILEMKAYLRTLVNHKKQTPQDDLITNLIAVHEEDRRFSMDELLSNVIILLFAGHETTSNLISNIVFELLSHPDQFELLKAQPDLTASAVTETLRYRSSVNGIGRFALEDFEYQNVHFKKGDLVRFALNAANRDPEIYTHPDHFDIQRQEETPLSFGHGIHYCLGAPLATLETEIVLEKLIDFMPNMQLKNPEPQWMPSVAIQGHSELHLRY